MIKKIREKTMKRVGKTRMILLMTYLLILTFYLVEREAASPIEVSGLTP